MKKIIFALMFIILFLMACEDKKPPVNKALLKAQRHERTVARTQKEMRYPAILLSAKYSLDEKKVFDLLNESQVSLYEGSRHIVTMETINDYSKKYQIKATIIASILIDLQFMQCDNRLSE